MQNEAAADLKNKVSCIAESVETGLSIKEANNEVSVIATLGKANFLHIETQNLGKKVILCLDNDGTKTFADNVIHDAANRLIKAGKDVYTAMPNQIKNDKTDFNDVSRIEGLSFIKTALNNAIVYKEWRSNTMQAIEQNNSKALTYAAKIIRDEQ